MVFVMNEGARRLYERLGFVAFEEVGPYIHMEWRGE
jgi:RimJ/RimL family protein N-acetyltransferase